MNSEGAVTRFLPDPAATEALGRALGERLRTGDVVGLTGELGAGKTLLSRGIAQGLQVADPDAVCSPTYLLVVEHPGPVPFLHADAYLPAKLQGFLADGGLDYLAEREAVVVVEWADRIRDLLPEATLWVHLEPRGGGRMCRLAGPFPWLHRLPGAPA